MELSKKVATQFAFRGFLIILLYLLNNTSEARFQNGKVTGGFDCSKNSSVIGSDKLHNSSYEFNNFQLPLPDIGGNGSVGDNCGGEHARAWELFTGLGWWKFVTKPIRRAHNNINHGAAYGYCDVSDKNTQQSSTTKIDNGSRKLEINFWLIVFGFGLLVVCFLSHCRTSSQHYQSGISLFGQVILCLLQLVFLEMVAAIPIVDVEMNFERKRQPEDNGNEVDTWSNNYCLANSTSFTTLLNRRSPLSPFPSDALLYFGLIFIPTMLIYLTWEYKRKSGSDEESHTKAPAPATSQRSRSVSCIRNTEVDSPAASQVPSTRSILPGETNDFCYKVNCFTNSRFGFSVHSDCVEFHRKSKSYVRILLIAEPDITTYKIDPQPNGLLIVSVKNTYDIEFFYLIYSPHPVSSRDLTASRYNEKTIEILGPGPSSYYPNPAGYKSTIAKTRKKKADKIIRVLKIS